MNDKLTEKKNLKFLTHLDQDVNLNHLHLMIKNEHDTYLRSAKRLITQYLNKRNIELDSDEKDRIRTILEKNYIRDFKISKPPKVYK